MDRRQLLACLGVTIPLAGCTSVFGPRGRFDESTSLDRIVLQADELPDYQLREQFRDTYDGELVHLTRRFVKAGHEEGSLPDLSSSASVYPSPRRAANAVDELARVDYGRSTRYELEGRPTLEWTGADRVRIGASDSNLFLLVQADDRGDGEVERATDHLERMFADIPPQASPDSS